MADDTGEEIVAERQPWYVRGWQGFNRWRRKYWLTRVLILLIIFGLPLVERLGHVDILYNLLGIAIQAIQLSSEPTLEYHYFRFYESQEVLNLRCLLLRELHADADGRLDAAGRQRAEGVGLDPAQLRVPSPQADLDQLTRAATALGVVPVSYSLAKVREEARYAAQAKAAEIISREHRALQAELDKAYAWPDYGKWATWREGLTYFTYGVVESATELGTGLWLLLCFLAALGVGAQVRRRRLAGFVAGAGVSAGLFLLFAGPSETLWTGLQAVALLCSGAAVGLWAGGLARGIRRPRLAAFVCALVGGVALVFSGIPGVRTTAGYLRWALELPPLRWWEPYLARADSIRIVLGLLLILLAACIAAPALWARRTSDDSDAPR